MPTKIKNNAKLLLAIDGSNNALEATLFVRDVLGDAGYQITTLTVEPFSKYQQPGNFAALLVRAENIFKQKAVEIETRLLQGTPADTIIDYARVLKPELIVLGAVGLRATLGILLGGVAQQVIEYSCCPVLVIRGEGTRMQNILVALDGSESSTGAVDYLSRFPLPDGANLHFMSVFPPIPGPEIFAHSWAVSLEAIDALSLEEMRQELAARAGEEEESLQDSVIAPAMQKFEGKPYHLTSSVPRGDAATEIINFSKNTGVDCIVVGSRGLSKLQSWLLGSVSRKLVHYANCSVLVVRTPEQQPENEQQEA